jgi:hypothetical protein
MKGIDETAAEWEKAKDDLWDSVYSLVNKFNGTDDSGRDRFRDIRNSKTSFTPEERK